MSNILRPPSKCERPKHLLKAKSQSDFWVSLICPSDSRSKAVKKVFFNLPYSILVKGYRTFRKRIKKYGVIVIKLLSGKTYMYLEIKYWQTRFCRVYV